MIRRRSRSSAAGCAVAWALGAAPPAAAGPADVVAVRALCRPDRVCRFDVTLRHADEGWSHYADRWDVVAPDGSVIAVRRLLHPHVDEQPFTRFLDGVSVPEGVDRVRVRAHDSVHGLGGVEAVVALRFDGRPTTAGPEPGSPDAAARDGGPGAQAVSSGSASHLGTPPRASGDSGATRGEGPPP